MYESDYEQQIKMKIFFENKYEIDQHNKKYENDEVSYQLDVNEFADLTHQQFMQMIGVNYFK